MLLCTDGIYYKIVTAQRDGFCQKKKNKDKQFLLEI